MSVIAVLPLLSGIAIAQPADLFEPVAWSGVTDGDAPDRRVRATSVRFDRLPAPAGAVGAQFAFNLFDDVRVNATVTAAHEELGFLVLSGDLEGEPEGDFLVVVGPETLSAEVRSARLGSYDIQHAPGGVHLIREIDDLQWKPCATGHEHEEDGAGHGEDPHAPRGTPLIRVLVAYTPAARDAQGGDEAIQGRAVFAINQANGVYTSSNAAVQLQLAYTGLVNYTESGNASTELSRLRSRTDGFMDEVHCLRDVHGADMVSLLVGNMTNACGIAYLMTNPGSGFATSAFSVTDKDCINGYTFAHELGHNMGCAHDRDNAGNAAFSYAYGYRTPDEVYRTVMAYAPGTRIGRFSNPNITYDGYVMGIALGQPGETYNALAITNTAPVIEQFRDGPRPPVDFNGDGVGDQDDIACVILAVAGDSSCSPHGAGADFDLDGVADQGDVAELILLVAGGGSCPP